MSLAIKTERLLLRRFHTSDTEDLLRFISHPSVAQAVSEMEPTMAGVQKYINRQNSFKPFERDQCFDLAIQFLEADPSATGRVIGLLTLITREHQMGEIGWALGIENRGRGYATEAAAGLIQYAFSELKLHRIQASTSSANPDSIKVMDRLGMRREAYLREKEYRDGSWTDELIYGLLAGDHPVGD